MTNIHSALWFTALYFNPKEANITSEFLFHSTCLHVIDFWFLLKKRLQHAYFWITRLTMGLDHIVFFFFSFFKDISIYNASLSLAHSLS